MRLGSSILVAAVLAACGTPQLSGAGAAPAPTGQIQPRARRPVGRQTPVQRFTAWADGVARDQAALEAATNGYDASIRQAIRSRSYDRALRAFEAYDDAVGAVYRRLGPVPANNACSRVWAGPAGEVARAESDELEAYERVIARLRRIAEDGAGRSVAGFALSEDRRSLDRARAAIAFHLEKARSAAAGARGTCWLGRQGST